MIFIVLRRLHSSLNGFPGINVHFDDEKGGGTRGEGKIVRQTALRYQMLVGNSSRLAALRTISKVNRSGITTFSLMLKDFQWFSLFFTDCILRWMNFNNCLCFFQEFVHVCNDLQWFHEFPRISIFRKGLQCSKDFHMFSIVFVCSLVS